MMSDDKYDSFFQEDKTSGLEDLVTQELLVELLNKKQAEVFENVVFSGKRRYYIEDLSKRDYTLENTTPYQIDIYNNIIEQHAWGNLLCDVSRLLLRLFPRYENDILDFRCSWTKADIFSLVQKTNFKMVHENLYINCNHSAVHSCWTLQDLLDYFKIDKSSVYFLIHRPCGVEPEHIKDYVEKRFINGFVFYLKTKQNMSEEYANKVVRNIKKYLNPMLGNISKSYTNLFLFDDNATFYNYVKSVREYIATRVRAEDKVKKFLNRYLDYLVEYYRE